MKRGKLRKDKDGGVPEPVAMWRAKKGKKEDDTFFYHTILLEPAVGRYIDHVLRSKNVCLILNPASHLRLHDNLQGGYFKKIKFLVKLTCTKSDNLYSQIHASIDGIPYHTTEEEFELKEYIKRTLGVIEEINSTDRLMKNHVRIQQLISDMNNTRSRDPFQYTRRTVWVSPSGESQLLDYVFHDDAECVKALFNKGVFNEKCIPAEKDMAEALAATFDKLDMFDEMYVHVKKDQERLNAATYSQPRIRVYGVIHSENFTIVYGRSVANLYHYPINNRIAKSMGVPMSSYIYDFMKIIWERTRDIMPSAARYIPPNHFSQHFYYSKFKGELNKHMDVKNKKDGTSQFSIGTPIISVTISHPMLFEVYAQWTRTVRRLIQAMQLHNVQRHG
jgi:hypothetical protein